MVEKKSIQGRVNIYGVQGRDQGGTLKLGNCVVGKLSIGNISGWLGKCLVENLSFNIENMSFEKKSNWESVV